MKQHYKISMLLVFSYTILISCGKNEGTTPNDSQPKETNTPVNNPSTPANTIYDIDSKGIPKFVIVNYIELDKIYRISRFRSGEGHDYSDAFESCRSMKHYFMPPSNLDWSTVKIFSPVKGKVFRIIQDWVGTQIQVESEAYPAFHFIIFHVNTSLHEGDPVLEGQQIGTHISSQTMSDIAVEVQVPSGRKLVSYFDTMTDALFQQYQSRGVNSPNSMIITKAERDAAPLSCTGEAFANSGSIENWVILN